MPRWKEYVPILIKKSFIIEKPRARKESQPLNKSHKNNKRQKIYQIDKSLSGLILESMNKEEVVDFDRKIVQLIVNKSKHKWHNYFDSDEFLEIYEENIWAAINRMSRSGKYESNIQQFNKTNTINMDDIIEGGGQSKFKHMQTMVNKSNKQNIGNILSSKMIKRKESNNKRLSKLFDL